MSVGISTLAVACLSLSKHHWLAQWVNICPRR